jgi:hypothetical protein
MEIHASAFYLGQGGAQTYAATDSNSPRFLFSIFCGNFRKETVIFVTDSAKLCLRRKSRKTAPNITEVFAPGMARGGKGERKTMKNNQINVPQAKQAMDQFKMQAAQEVGVNLTNGYNGHLTSREAGSVGGQMVKKMTPIRITKYERHNRIAPGHIQIVQYITTLTV